MCFVENIDFDGKSGFTYASEFGIGYYDLSKGLMLRFSYAKSYAPHKGLQISRHRGETTEPDQRREVRMTAVNLLKQLYRPNLIYRSTGVTLTHLSYGEVQQSLFEEVKPHDDKLSHLVDELKAKFGKGIVKTGV